MNSTTYSRALKPTPAKHQAIIIPAQDEINLIEYVIAVGQIIGPEAILSASKIAKKSICLYLDKAATVDNLLLNSSSKIIVKGVPLHVRRFVAPSRRIIFSNVHTCIPNSSILEALQKLGVKPTSAIHDLHIGLTSDTIPQSELARYKHVTSFRRAVYIADEGNIILPSSILITMEGESYRVLINESDQRCHICGDPSHNVLNCSTPNPPNHSSNTAADPPGQSTNHPETVPPKNSTTSSTHNEDKTPFDDKLTRAR